MTTSNILPLHTTESYFRHMMVLVGEPNVGKSSLVIRYTSGTFNQEQEPTIGATFLSKTVDGGKLDIWDISGTEAFQTLSPLFLRNPQTAVIVYDVTNKESFLKVKTWIAHVEVLGLTTPVIVLVGNKCDLTKKREVSVDEGLEFAEKQRVVFVETSARNGHNLDVLFEVIIVDRLTPLRCAASQEDEEKEEDFVFLGDDVKDSPSCVVVVKKNFIGVFGAELANNLRIIISRIRLFKRKRRI